MCRTNICENSERCTHFSNVMNRIRGERRERGQGEVANAGPHDVHLGMSNWYRVEDYREKAAPKSTTPYMRRAERWIKEMDDKEREMKQNNCRVLNTASWTSEQATNCYRTL